MSTFTNVYIHKNDLQALSQGKPTLAYINLSDTTNYTLIQSGTLQTPYVNAGINTFIIKKKIN